MTSISFPQSSLAVMEARICAQMAIADASSPSSFELPTAFAAASLWSNPVHNIWSAYSTTRSFVNASAEFTRVGRDIETTKKRMGDVNQELKAHPQLWETMRDVFNKQMLVLANQQNEADYRSNVKRQLLSSTIVGLLGAMFDSRAILYTGLAGLLLSTVSMNMGVRETNSANTRSAFKLGDAAHKAKIALEGYTTEKTLSSTPIKSE